MRSWVARGVLAASLLAGGLVGGVSAQETVRQERMENLLASAVDLFEQGRWVQAKASLDRLLAEDPTQEEAWALREAFGDRIVRDMAMWMQHGQTLGPAALEILTRAQAFEQKQLYDPAAVEQTVSDAVKSERLPQKDLFRIHRLGQFAVPSLVQHLRAGRNELARTNATYILTHLGTPAVQPLIEMLNDKDELLLQHVCTILGSIRPRDPRSLPVLKRIYEANDRLPALKAAAGRALLAVSGQAPESLPSAVDLYYAEANRLYMGGPAVSEEMDDLRGTLWIWAEGTGGTPGVLKHVTVPAYELDDLMTQELVYDALDLGGRQHDLQVLLSASLMQQYAEAESMKHILDRQAVEDPGLATRQAELKIWNDRLHLNDEIAWATGPDLLMGVLEKALMDGKSEVAVAALEGLETIAQPEGWAMVADWRPVLDAPAAPEDVSAMAPPAEGQPAQGEPLKPVATPAPASASAAAYDNPLLTALDNPDRRVRIAAANCLVRIGLPSGHARYADVAARLVEGAQENAARVVLVISDSAPVRERFARLLTEQNVQVVTAPSGREGFALAQQYPPKDAILIDSEVDEFGRLHERLKLHDLVGGSPLPLTIVTTRTRADDVMKMFGEELWEIKIRENVTADKPNLYDELHMMERYRKDRRVLAILLQEDVKERRRIQQELQLQAERRGRPQRQSELLQLLQNRRDEFLSDIFPVRSTFVNVFVDEDLSGFSAMETLQKLRSWPATKHVPTAILTTGEREKFVKAEFEKFLENASDARLMPVEVERRDLAKAVEEMATANPLSQQNYIRRVCDRVATRSAEGLCRLDPRAGVTVPEEEVNGLREVLKDVNRPQRLRTNVARLVSHLGLRSALKTLQGVFENEPAENVELRKWCMYAIGTNDRANEFEAVKLKAIREDNIEIQRAAARALALGSSEMPYRHRVLRELRPNAPLALTEAGPMVPEPFEAKDKEPLKPAAATPTAGAAATGTAETPAETPKKDDKPADTGGGWDTGIQW